MIPNINLLPKAEKQRSAVYKLFVPLLFIWLILSSIVVYEYVNTKNNLKQADLTITQLNLEKDALQAQIVNKRQQASDSLHQSLSFIEQLTLPTSTIIENLFEHLPDHSYLTQYEYNNGQVSVQTQFESLDVVAGYISELNASPLFSDVKVDQVTAFSLEEESDEQLDIEEKFKQVPRYDVKLILMINPAALAEETGGDNND